MKRKGHTVRFPHFTRIDLVTGTMPPKSDGKVIFCCAGSFTGERLTSFKHSNIAGDHVSGGTFHKGYKCGPYNGVFTWSERSGWHFYNYSYKNAPAPLQRAAEEGGMGFRHTSSPAVLTENLFMDNPADCAFLLSPEGQQTLVDLDVDSITSYLSIL